MSMKPSQELKKILDNYWEAKLRRSPSLATFTGDYRFNDQLEKFTVKTFEEGMRWLRSVERELKSVSEKGLSVQDQISRSMLLEDIALSKEFHKIPTHYLCIDQMSGPHLGFLNIARVHPFKTLKDYRDYVSRLEAHSLQLSQCGGHLRRGLKQGWTLPRYIVTRVISQLKDLTKPAPRLTRHFQMAEEGLKNLSEGDQQLVGDLMEAVMVKKVMPALLKLSAFLETEYLPLARTTIGLCDLPHEKGKKLYALYVQSHTGMQKNPREIHALGLREVRRIHNELSEIQDAIGFSGSLGELFNFMREDKSRHYSSREEIVSDHRSLLAEMEKKLPQYFSHLPKNPYEVTPMPEYQERSAPDAYYMPGDSKRGRSGTYFVNTYEPFTRARYNAEALAYHEAVPGHHLQISVAQELKHLPEFRKRAGETAYVEGWALYTEKLAQEMGFYQDPASKFGRLTFEVWRACRLVVDTGIHALGWTREQAIEYFTQNSGLSRANIEVEVDRYIVMPGQALSYKIGEIFILDLRKKLQEKEKENFDIRKFHENILKNGALPLPVLGSLMLDG
jgi:uncharacterized protein (DUF885 family)